jgi:hypothetical protein
LASGVHCRGDHGLDRRCDRRGNEPHPIDYRGRRPFAASA